MLAERPSLAKRIAPDVVEVHTPWKAVQRTTLLVVAAERRDTTLLCASPTLTRPLEQYPDDSHLDMAYLDTAGIYTEQTSNVDALGANEQQCWTAEVTVSYSQLQLQSVTVTVSYSQLQSVTLHSSGVTLQRSAMYP